MEYLAASANNDDWYEDKYGDMQDDLSPVPETPYKPEHKRYSAKVARKLRKTAVDHLRKNDVSAIDLRGSGLLAKLPPDIRCVFAPIDDELKTRARDQFVEAAHAAGELNQYEQVA
jgi:hypothetical protein